MEGCSTRWGPSPERFCRSLDGYPKLSFLPCLIWTCNFRQQQNYVRCFDIFDSLSHISTSSPKHHFHPDVSRNTDVNSHDNCHRIPRPRTEQLVSVAFNGNWKAFTSCSESCKVGQ